MTMSHVKSEHGERHVLAPRVWTDEGIERAFRELWRDFTSGNVLLDRIFDGGGSALHIEEFTETADGESTYVLRAELPGIDPERDVEVTLREGLLSVIATRTERDETDRPDGYRSEFRYGRFERSMQLPEGTDADSVTASYDNGILEVRVPITKEIATPQRKIAVKHS